MPNSYNNFKSVKGRLFTRLLQTALGFSILASLGAQAATTPNPYPDFTYPNANYSAVSGASAEQIKHGEYLVKAGDCIACHTVDGGKPFAGGFPFKTPFGTMYAPNITPDKETGIGAWTDEQFVRAVREGISPKGQYYYPAFPFPYFNKLSHQDALDIRAYLSSIPAVHQQNIPLDMKFPFGIRKLQSFWRFMFFDFYKGEFVPDKNKSPEWNRGAYLVQGLGHCSMCHTPLNPLGAPVRKYDLTGGQVDTYHAPNISASALKDVPTEKVLGVFQHDTRIKGGSIQGPMLQVNHDSLKYLSTADLSAIVTYLRTVESKMPPAPSVGTGEKAGAAIYEKYCAGCHNMGGGGAPKFADASQWAPYVSLGMPQLYENAIKGIRGMPPKGTCDSCSEDQVKTAVDYIVNHSRLKAGEKVTQTEGSPAQSLTSFAKGKQVYDQTCYVCHNNGDLGAPKLGDKAVWAPLIDKHDMDVLVNHAINGYKGHPAKGACYQCTDVDIISAVKYMAQESGTGDYRLW